MLYVFLSLIVLLDLLFLLLVKNLEKRLNILSRFLYESGYLDDIDEEFWECQ